jgi:hypothetical protein
MMDNKSAKSELFFKKIALVVAVPYHRPSGYFFGKKNIAGYEKNVK